MFLWKEIFLSKSLLMVSGDMHMEQMEHRDRIASTGNFFHIIWHFFRYSHQAKFLGFFVSRQKITPKIYPKLLCSSWWWLVTFELAGSQGQIRSHIYKFLAGQTKKQQAFNSLCPATTLHKCNQIRPMSFSHHQLRQKLGVSHAAIHSRQGMWDSAMILL